MQGPMNIKKFNILLVTSTAESQNTGVTVIQNNCI